MQDRRHDFLGYPVVLPSRHDPRLRVAVVILSVHALGQGPLRFDVSIAQILCALLVCAVIEVGITFTRTKTIAWPASALLTGSGVALLLRIPGTEHGDWWSTRGAPIVAGTAAVSLLSKYVFRVRGHQVFNPSNIGLVACFLVLGSQRVDPQDLWWGPTNWGLVVAVVLIVGGGFLVTRALGFVWMVLAFWMTFAAGAAVNSAGGHCITTRWSFEPVCDTHYFTTVAFSPEVLVFLFFMITDPRSTPRGRVPRVVFGASVGAVAGLLVAFQRTEFATKVAILSALAIVCVARPLIERVRRVSPVVVLVFAAYLVWVVALDSRVGDDIAPVTTGAAFSAPAIGDVELPPVEVDPEVSRIAQGFDDVAARAAAADLVLDLETEVRAITTRDASLARGSSAAARLDAVVAVIDGRAATLPTYKFRRMRVTLFRSTPQARPQVRVETTATVSTVSADGTITPLPAADATVLVTMVDGPFGTHLISEVS